MQRTLIHVYVSKSSAKQVAYVLVAVSNNQNYRSIPHLSVGHLALYSLDFTTIPPAQSYEKAGFFGLFRKILWKSV